MKLQSRNTFYLPTFILVTTLMISACSLVGSAVTQPESTEAAQLVETLEQVEEVVTPIENSPNFSIEPAGLAAGYQSENVAAVANPSEAPYWEALPAHTRVSLQGYPIGSHQMQPQIFIYPVNEVVQMNEAAGKVVTQMQTLIQSPQELPDMPFLPLINASQVMHTHVQFLDFKNGKGVRYITEFSQGIVPVNNQGLIFTYQGLTDDGKYYVAVVLPVNHQSLPVDGTITGNEPPEFSSDYQTYLTNTAATLNTQASSTFTPDLTQLDFIIGSMEIK